MPRWRKIDEIHVSLFIPAGPTRRGMRAALADPRLLAGLRAVARRVLTRSPALREVRVAVSR
jgi:hypothetical protein